MRTEAEGAESVTAESVRCQVSAESVKCQVSGLNSRSPLKPETCLSALSAPSAFSLIELLVVIAIIAILAALLTPAVRKMIAGAARAKTGAQTVAIANAIRAYRSTYASWPGQIQGALDGKADPRLILNALTNNPRGIIFLDVKVGQITNGYLLDSWKRYIKIACDENADGNVNVAASDWVCDGPAAVPGISTTTNVMKQTVIVMSWGPDPSDPDKWVQSWHR